MVLEQLDQKEREAPLILTNTYIQAPTLKTVCLYVLEICCVRYVDRISSLLFACQVTVAIVSPLILAMWRLFSTQSNPDCGEMNVLTIFVSNLKLVDWELLI